MSYNRPIVLSIAGFDPSGGAGVLADVKTLEQHHCLGMAVISANTIQTEDSFLETHWTPIEDIKNQTLPLLLRYNIDVVKIGMIQNLTVLNELTQCLKQYSQSIKIIWDTVLSASAGFSFIEKTDTEQLITILQNIYLITPNYNEIKILANNDDDVAEAQKQLAQYTNVLLKGGHNPNLKGTDILLTTENKKTIIAPNDTNIIYAKHGSGCVLSAAIAANIAKGNVLEASCVLAKKYIETILNSNPNLLAYHNV